MQKILTDLRAKLAMAENEVVRIQYADDFCFSNGSYDRAVKVRNDFRSAVEDAEQDAQLFAAGIATASGTPLGDETMDILDFFDAAIKRQEAGISTIIRARLAEGRSISDEDVRALLNKNKKLREAIEMARECIDDKDVIGARQTLTTALGETQ